MSKKIVLLGHGIGVKFTIESLERNSGIDYQVVGVVTHPREDHKHDLEMIEKRGSFYGEYAYKVFEVEQDYNVALLESPDVNLPETIEWIANLDPEYIISIGCRNIIKKKFLEQFRNKVLNIHTTPLPRYRGAAGDSWMILNGEWGKEQYGCIHFVDEGLDSGDIVAKSYYQIKPYSYPIDVFKSRMDTFKDLLVKAITALRDPDFSGEKQDMEKATVFPRLFTPVDGRINWGYGGQELLKFIYAFGYPHEGAHCFLEKVKINILEAEFFPENIFHPFTVGIIFGKDTQGNYKISVNGGYLLLKKIEINGRTVEQKKIMKLGRRLS